MKKIILTSLIAGCASFGLSSCMNGDYDANPAVTASGANPLTPPSTGGGGGGITGNFKEPSYYTWTGTDPVSAKIDGTAYQGTGGNVITSGGSITITTSGGGKGFTITLPDNASVGTVYTLTSSSIATVSLSDGGSFLSALGSGGGVYIDEIDGSHIKGKFAANLKSLSSGGGSRNVTEGYFNLSR